MPHPNYALSNRIPLLQRKIIEKLCYKQQQIHMRHLMQYLPSLKYQIEGKYKFRILRNKYQKPIKNKTFV